MHIARACGKLAMRRQAAARHAAIDCELCDLVFVEVNQHKNKMFNNNNKVATHIRRKLPQTNKQKQRCQLAQEQRRYSW